MRIDELPHKIIFGGMKHCGKTTHGKNFAHRLNLPFTDLDQLITEHYQSEKHLPKTVREIFTDEGKETFQRLEYLALKKWIEKADLHPQPQVLSLGGGIASNKEALKLFDNSLFFIYLYQPESVLYERIIRKGLPPFLNPKNPKANFSQIFKERSAVYEQLASLKIETGNRPKDETSKIVYNTIADYLNQKKREEE